MAPATPVPAIPQTKSIPVDGVNGVGGSLFTFSIVECSTTGYLSDFVRSLDEHLPHFVFSRKTIELYERRIREGIISDTLLQHAQKALQIATRSSDSGEFGEFLLYLFATKVLGALKIVSKIEHRDSRRSPVKGLDGTFFLVKNNEVYVLSGESKMKPDPNDGLREAQNDLNSFHADDTRTTHEIELASRQIVDEVNDQTWPIFDKKFLQQDGDGNFMNVIFVGYSCENFRKMRNAEITFEEFCSKTCEHLQRCFTNQQALIRQGGLATAFCFLPFEDIERARTTFLQHHELISLQS
ncbi:MAG: DUF1837 domain-containing protein [Candidatus Peribacteraceae bacterium]|nr:DUF1837 domain-containing protein [Candidatus Peribacteraceae bacterium]